MHTLRRRAACLTLGCTLVAFALAELPAAAATADPPLGTATSYAVLATSTITNTGPSVLSGDIGLDPGTSVTGFPPATIVGGSQQVGNAAAASAVADAHTAYADTASRAGTGAVTADLGNQDLVAGVYDGATLSLTGQLTLDGQNDPSGVFILRSATTLTTASDSTVVLVNGAQACHVFWEIGSSATLAVDSDFTGTVLAHDSITADTRAKIAGRLLALDGAVTLDDNTVSVPTCAAPTAGGGGGGTITSPTPSATPAVTPTVTPPVTPPVTPNPLASPVAGTSPVASHAASSATKATSSPAVRRSSAAARPAVTETSAGRAGAATRAGSTTGTSVTGAAPAGAAAQLTGGAAQLTGTGTGTGMTTTTSQGTPLAFTGADVEELLFGGGLTTALGVALLLSAGRPEVPRTGRHRRPR